MKEKRAWKRNQGTKRLNRLRGEEAQCREQENVDNTRLITSKITDLLPKLPEKQQANNNVVVANKNEGILVS